MKNLVGTIARALTVEASVIAVSVAVAAGLILHGITRRLAPCT